MCNVGYHDSHRVHMCSFDVSGSSFISVEHIMFWCYRVQVVSVCNTCLNHVSLSFNCDNILMLQIFFYRLVK